MKFFVWVNIRNFIFLGVYKKKSCFFFIYKLVFRYLSFPINFKVF